MIKRVIKKLNAVLLAATLLILATYIVAVAEQYPVSKTYLANVAENKPVTSSDPDTHTLSDYMINNINDGDRATFTLSEFGEERAGKESFTIDLLRRYKVERIELFYRYDYDTPSGRQYIDIIGANNEDFSDAVTLGSLTERDDSVFPHKGAFVVVTDGDSAYRYIRIQRTGNGDYQYAEVKVWAKQTVTDVSRDLEQDRIITDALSDDSHWVYDFAGPEKAFDGNTETAWIEDGNAYRYMCADLGERRHIGVIEMSARDFTADNIQDDYWSRSYINIYGSNTADKSESIFDADQAPDDEALSDKFVNLVRIGNMGNAIDGEVSFPAVYVPSGNEMTFGKSGKFSTTIDDTNAYRYFTYKKRQPTGAALSTFALYEINPIINSVDLTAGMLTVNFSDEMDSETVNESSVYLVGPDGRLNVPVAKTDNYTFTVDISTADDNKSYTLCIERSVKNQKGVSLCEKFEREYPNFSALAVESVTLHESSDGSGKGIDNFHNLDYVSVRAHTVNFSAENREVVLYVAQYSPEGSFLKASCARSVIAGGGNADIVVPFAVENSGENSILRTFVWECKQMYPITESRIFRNNLKDIYVSVKNGSDNASGTLTHPFKTIERAQREVRKYNEKMSEDINIYLLDGTYELEETLCFTSADSGKNGNYVNYKAYDGADVVITGGKKVENFTDEDGDGIYTAYVDNENITSIRELYVNGRKAVRAKSETKIAPISMYKADGKTLGYYVDSSDIGLFANAQDMQLHYSRGWASITINVKNLVNAGDGKTLVLMDEIPFELMTTFVPDETTPSPIDGKTYHIFWLTEQNKFYVENALELLDTEGEFYFDKQARILYYKPLTGEDITTAEVYVPGLEKLIGIKGASLDDKAENITFSGITFAYAKAEIFDRGFLGDQAQTQILFDAPRSAYAPGNTIVDANVTIEVARNIKFENNIFRGLAKVGLGLYNGSENVIVNGNVFCDTGDSAITIGTPQDAYMEDMSNGKNVAYNKNVISTVNEVGNFAAFANDGDLLRGWNIYDERTYVPGVTDYSKQYLQVDLEKEYKIDRIILKQRQTTVERTNFQLLGSNDADFAHSNVLYEMGGETDEKYTPSGDIICQISDMKKYRYIRLRKTVNEYFYLPEIEIISNDEKTPSKEVCKGNVISNNYITRAGEYNWGAPGIQAYYTEETLIDGNYIYDVPYSGICFGWGWINTPDSVTSKNTVVKNNRIENYAQRSYDAGGIYTLGQEPGSEICGNYLKNQVNAYGAYYPDSGSAYTYVHDNVFEDIDIAFHIHSDRQYNLTVEDNYSTNGYYVDRGENCTVDAPIVYVPTDIPEKAAQVVKNAGLVGQYAALKLKAAERHTVLTFEDMYGNAIEENNPNILSMPTFEVLIPNYLSRKILEAQKLLEMYPETAQETKSALQSAIDNAISVQNLGSAADRTDVIRERLALIDAIHAFWNKIN